MHYHTILFAFPGFMGLNLCLEISIWTLINADYKDFQSCHKVTKTPSFFCGFLSSLVLSAFQSGERFLSGECLSGEKVAEGLICVLRSVNKNAGYKCK
jgi:hypothetical protein